MDDTDFFKFLKANNLNNVFERTIPIYNKFGLAHAVSLLGQHIQTIPPEPKPNNALEVLERNYKLKSITTELVTYCLFDDIEMDKPSALSQQTALIPDDGWEYIFLKFNFWYTKDLAASIPTIPNIMPGELAILDRQILPDWNGVQKSLSYPAKYGNTTYTLYGNGGPENTIFRPFYSLPMITYCNKITMDPNEDIIHFLWDNQEKTLDYQKTIIGQTYKRDYYIFGDRPNKKMYFGTKIYGENFKAGANISIDLEWDKISFACGYSATQTGVNPQEEQGIFHYQYANHIKFIQANYTSDMENWLQNIII